MYKGNTHISPMNKIIMERIHDVDVGYTQVVQNSTAKNLQHINRKVFINDRFSIKFDTCVIF